MCSIPSLERSIRVPRVGANRSKGVKCNLAADSLFNGPTSIGNWSVEREGVRPLELGDREETFPLDPQVMRLLPESVKTPRTTGVRPRPRPRHKVRRSSLSVLD